MKLQFGRRDPAGGRLYFTGFLHLSLFMVFFLHQEFDSRGIIPQLFHLRWSEAIVFVVFLHRGYDSTVVPSQME